MAKATKPLAFLAFLLLSSLFLSGNARPMKAMEQQSFVEKEIMNILEDLYIEGIKTGGPSSGGEGNSAIHALNLEGIKRSGPSRGGAGN